MPSTPRPTIRPAITWWCSPVTGTGRSRRSRARRPAVSAGPHNLRSAFRSLTRQGALDLTDGGRLLFAVNAGDSTISAFQVTWHGLRLVDRVASGGTEPISLTSSGDLLYVLNEQTGNIAGFRFNWWGAL